MSYTAIDQIKAIQEKADKEIAALKAKAISEVVQRIAAAKAALSAVEEEYRILTGKDLKGEKIEGKRRRLSVEEKAALAESIKSILKSSTKGVKIGAIVSKTGQPVTAIRTALSSIKEIKTTGNKASTLYFLK